MASSRRYVARFNRSERAVHWIHAAAFFVLLGTGLVLYVPKLSEFVSRRGLVKGIHIWAAVAWIVALVAVFIAGDRSSLRATASEFNGFDADDRRWLRGRRAPQGRFNAGQKLNAALTAAFAILFTVSGAFLWLGERNTSFRFANTIVLHDGLTYISILLVVGHLYLAVIHPTTRHALRGITVGTVDEEWARAHHAKWTPSPTAAGDETSGQLTNRSTH